MDCLEVPTGGRYDVIAAAFGYVHKKDVPNNQAHPHEKGLYLGERKSVTVFCHKGNLRIDYRNARDALAGMNRGIGYQTT